MAKGVKSTYIFLVLFACVTSCISVRTVPNGKYLLTKNKISVQGDEIDKDEAIALLKQKPNHKSVGIKLKLIVFNSIDSTKIANKRLKKNIQLRVINKRRIEKQQRINQRRIEKARRKNRSHYTEKIIQLKDTVNPKRFLREWMKYKYGEPPVIIDSNLFHKSIEQLNVLLKNRGYFSAKIEGKISYKRHKRGVIRYLINTGPQYKIDSTYPIIANPMLSRLYTEFSQSKQTPKLVNHSFDKDYLNEYREKLAKFMRNNAVLSFSSSHVKFLADTIAGKQKVHLGVRLLDQIQSVKNKNDSAFVIPHYQSTIRTVYFHLCDTIYVEGKFQDTLQQLGLPLLEQQFIRGLDTLVYKEIINKKTHQVDPKRSVILVYNKKLNVHADVLEFQNKLEAGDLYSEENSEKTYTNLLQLGQFQVIKPVMVEVAGTHFIDVHYYLVSSKRQSFGVIPKGTTSNGFLGVSASFNYVNKNLFHGAERFTFSLSAGFESQPPVFNQTTTGSIQQSGRNFNTFEFGPSVKVELPQLFPFNVNAFSKKYHPRTTISAAYNYQLRTDFKRQILQLNYLWRFYVSNTQSLQIGVPGFSSVKFVQIEKSEAFQKKINALNDLFLKNAYSNQFVWQDWKLIYEYNNKNKEVKRTNFSVYLNSSLDIAGNILSLFKNRQDTLANGQHIFAGVAYTQFTRLDNEFIVARSIGKMKTINARFLAGVGMPYGNTTTSLPYDNSFFGGGANDNRGFLARSMHPGNYKYYLDTNRTATQTGDVRIAASLEYRFPFSKRLRGAVFIDAGNIWTVNQDKNRLGSQFGADWYTQIVFSAGFGLRIDFDFFVVRFDLGIPLSNPALPKGERWIFQPKDQYLLEHKTNYGADYMAYYYYPYIPTLQFGIGYPF